MIRVVYWVALVSFLLAMTLLPFGLCYSMDFGNPHAAKLEAERRGSHVEMVGGNQAGESAAFLSAVGMPVDDSDKWSISIVSTKHCGPCERLKQDFASSKYLQAWVDVSNPRESFCHFNTYYVEDQMQNWRFANITFRQYPTIVINPPKNGRCGPPSDFIVIEGYNGDHKTLANVIRSEIKQYSYKHNVDPRSQGYTVDQKGRVISVPKNPPEAVSSGEDGSDPINGSGVDPISLGLAVLTIIPGGIVTLTVIVLGIWLLIRQRRESLGKKVLLSDEQFSALVEIAKKDAAIIQGNIPSGSVQSYPPSAN